MTPPRCYRTLPDDGGGRRPPAPHPALATAAQAAAREFLASPERAIHVPPAPPPAAASHHLDSTPPPAPPVHASATLTAAQAAARSMSAAPAPAATGAGSFDANAVTDSVIPRLRRQQDAARELLDHDVAPANHRDGAPTPSVDSDSDSDSDSGDDEDAMDATTPPPPSGSPVPDPGDWRASGYRRGVGGALARADGRLHGRCCRRARGVGVLRRARVRQWRRVPSAVAHGVGDSDSWRCADSRGARYAGCHPPQELDDDEIDRRVNAARGGARALLAASRAEAERLKRRKEATSG